MSRESKLAVLSSFDPSLHLLNGMSKTTKDPIEVEKLPTRRSLPVSQRVLFISDEERELEKGEMKLTVSSTAPFSQRLSKISPLRLPGKMKNLALKPRNGSKGGGSDGEKIFFPRRDEAAGRRRRD